MAWLGRAAIRGTWADHACADGACTEALTLNSRVDRACPRGVTEELMEEMA
jgi:hypothetical protein